MDLSRICASARRLLAETIVESFLKAREPLIPEALHQNTQDPTLNPKQNVGKATPTKMTLTLTESLDLASAANVFNALNQTGLEQL